MRSNFHGFSKSRSKQFRPSWRFYFVVSDPIRQPINNDGDARRATAPYLAAPGTTVMVQLT
jgi:hypothetical protein